MRNFFRRLLVVSVGTLTMTLAGIVYAEVELNPAHPERYTVQRGDTLWGIAGRFLKDPWRWPAIWKRNDRIENPHLIYPGDVLVMTFVGGEPQLRLLRRERLRTVKLSPAIYSDPIDEAIPTIPPNVIHPFLTTALVVDEGALDAAGHVMVDVDDNVVLGKYMQFYARGLENPDQELYQIFRPAQVLIDPDTTEELGQETIFLGYAELRRFGEISKLEILESREEVVPGDRLLPAERDIGLPHFFPRSPDSKVQGRILRSLRGVAEMGPLSVVIISLGEREGMEEGHVLRIMRYRGTHKDPIDGKLYQLPTEPSGLIMVFRTFEKVSYALVVNATRPARILDVVQTP